MRRSILAVLSAGACVLALAVPAQAARSKAPAPAHHLRAGSITTTSLTLAWSNPSGGKFHRTVVRMKSGSTAPGTAHAGMRVASLGRSKHRVTVKHLTAGTSYAFSVFTGDGHGHFARAATLRTGTRTSAPSGPAAYDDPSSTVVRWTNPHGAERIVVRYAKGVAAPTSPSRGSGAHLSSSRATAARISRLTADTRYAVSIFSIDRFGHVSAPAVVRFTTPGRGAAPKGIYNGRVTDTHGQPLAGASVYAESDFGSAEPVETDATGAFHFSLSAGSWSFEADGSRATGGYSDASGYQSADTAPVEVAVGKSVTGPPIELTGGGILTGRVTDVSGTPLADAFVYLVPVSPYVSTDFGGGFFGAGFGDVSQTASDGTYSLHGVPDQGAVRVCAFSGDTTTAANSPSADYFGGCSRRSTLVHAGETAATADLALRRGTGGTLTGHVKGTDGKPVSGAYAVVNGPDDFFDFAEIEDDGSYDFSGLAPGGYTVCVDASTLSTTRSRTGYAPGCAKSAKVSVGHETTVDLTLKIGAAATGRVLASGGAPVAGVPVVLSGSVGYASTRTDSRGHFRAIGLTPGKYRACFYGAYGTSPKVPTGVLTGCYAKRAAFTVTQGQTRTGIDGVLAVGGAISGRITDTNGAPVSGAYVYAESASDDEDDFDAGGSAQTGADGRYVIRGLTAGSYDVCAQGATAADTEDETCRSTASRVALRRTTPSANLVLAASTGISVTVKDQNGDPVAGVDAVAVAPCGEDCDPDAALDPDYGVRVSASSVSDADGEVTLDGLSPGRYAVCLHAYYGTTAAGGSPTGYADTCTAKDPKANSRFAVFVVRGGLTAQSLVLPTGGAVSGHVTDGTGTPVADVTMHVDGSAADNARVGYADDFGFDDSDSPLDDSTTDETGAYSVIGVRPGASKVCADTASAAGSESPGGYLDACWSGPGGNTVTITAGQTTAGVDLSLGGAAAITGKVTTSLKHALPQVDVYVFEQGASKVVGYASTAADGTFVVGHLAAGSYQVCFDGYELGYGRQCYSNIAWTSGPPPLTRATAVPVADKSRVTGVNGVLRVE